MNLAPYIDHTILKQTTTLAEVKQICTEASQYGFAAVCVPPMYVHFAAAQLKGSAVKTATVVGFPFGYTYGEIKAAEAEKALSEGAHEIDMVISVAALKNKDYSYLEAEASQVAAVVKKQGGTLKLIIESGILTNEEIITCCDLYKSLPVDYLKTSTGYAEKGATIEAVQLMRQHLPSSIQIKASGGIRTTDFARQLVEAGATRLGCSASVAIVKGGLDLPPSNY